MRLYLQMNGFSDLLLYTYDIASFSDLSCLASSMCYLQSIYDRVCSNQVSVLIKQNIYYYKNVFLHVLLTQDCVLIVELDKNYFRNIHKTITAFSLCVFFCAHC